MNQGASPKVSKNKKNWSQNWNQTLLSQSNGTMKIQMKKKKTTWMQRTWIQVQDQRGQMQEQALYDSSCLCFTQMSARKGIERFGQLAVAAMLKEYKQLDDLVFFGAVSPD